MTKIDHEIFGKLTYEVYWKRDYIVPFLGQNVTVTLVVNGDEDAEFERSQMLAFKEFEAHKSGIMKEVENSLLSSYLESFLENRRKITENVDKVVPMISQVNDLNKVLSILKVVVSETFDEGEREIGLLFDATWEPELGVGVKVVNEKIVEVGTQDIVL